MSDPPPNTSLTAQSPPAEGFALVNLADGTTYPLHAGPNTIGRSPKSDIVLQDHAASRRHCVVMVHDTGECEVGDADSRNGIRVNHRRVHLSRFVPGDVLEVADSRFLFTWATSVGNQARLAFEDETLGVVVWDGAHRCWHFGVRLATGSSVLATYTPTDSTPAVEPGWEGVRACSRWIRANEPTVRIHVAGIRTAIGWSTVGRLSHIIFTPNQTATLIYDRTDDAVCVTINGSGEFLSGLTLVGKGSDGVDEDVAD